MPGDIVRLVSAWVVVLLMQPQTEAAMALRLTSRAFSEGGEIPTTYACAGQDFSPPLAWTGVPEGTRSLALIVDDPDAPDPRAPKMT